MQLTEKQISKIKQTVELDSTRSIVRVDVSHKNEGWSLDEICSNIYCVDKLYKVIWQVKEIKSDPPFDGRDPFCYLARTDSGEIMAARFSGFRYKIDPNTGEAEQTGFRK